jgi:hypothetical protein
MHFPNRWDLDGVATPGMMFSSTLFYVTQGVNRSIYVVG